MSRDWSDIVNGRDSSESWVKTRQAMHAAALKDAREKSIEDLCEDLVSLAADCADRAGDLTDHEDAEHDITQEAICLRAVELLRKLKGGAP